MNTKVMSLVALAIALVGVGGYVLGHTSGQLAGENLQAAVLKAVANSTQSKITNPTTGGAAIKTGTAAPKPQKWYYTLTTLGNGGCQCDVKNEGGSIIYQVITKAPCPKFPMASVDFMTLMATLNSNAITGLGSSSVSSSTRSQ